jgi:hypothetical protein
MNRLATMPEYYFDDLTDLCEQQRVLIERQAAEIRALKVRVAELERRPLHGLEREIDALRPHRPAKLRVCDLMKLVPNGIVSAQAVNVWCDSGGGFLEAERLDGRAQWWVNPDRFWDRVEKLAAKKGIVFARPTV